MSRFARFVRYLSVVLLALLPVSLCGCPGGGGSDDFIRIGTGGTGGAFYQVGAAISNAMSDGKEDAGWKNVTAEETGGSLENLKRLEKGELHIGMTNSSISYLAVNGKGGFDKKYKVKTVMTLFPLIAMFVTKADSGIESIKDLEGKTVVIGPEGGGFEHFVRPIVEAHDVDWGKITKIYSKFSASVGLLQDGSAQAAFLGGGRKSPSITSAATTMSIRLVPYDKQAMETLISDFPSFNAVTVPANTYKGQTEDFHGYNVGSAQLLVREDASKEFVENVIKAIWKNRKKIAETHAAGKSINANNVARHTGVDFHPAAEAFYKAHKEIKWGGAAPSGKKPSDNPSK